MNTLWQKFTDLSTAQAYCDTLTAWMNYPVTGVTQNWTMPLLLSDQITYVVQLPLNYIDTVGAVSEPDGGWQYYQPVLS